jgi:phage/plasmid primase-like uncharacterized protein
MTVSSLRPSGFRTMLNIHQEIHGRVPELVAALPIDPEALIKHVFCPFVNHRDRRPSFRIDASKARFYCSCTSRGGSLVDLVLRLHGHENASDAIQWIRAQLNRNHTSSGPITAYGMNKLGSTATLSTMPVEPAKRYARQTIFSAVLDRCIPGNCSPNSLHPYVRRKGILPINAVVDPFTKRLVLKVHDVDGVLQGLQFIDANGQKRFARGTKLHGNGLLIGELGRKTQLAFCEGWATGVTIHRVLGIPVVVTFSANNLMAAAQRFAVLAKQRYIFGENDTHGAGQQAARDAAEAVQGRFWLPPEKFIGDFNDFHTPYYRGYITNHSPTRFGIVTHLPT